MLTNPLYSGFTCLFIYFSVFEMYYSGDFCLVYPFYLSNALYLWNTGGWWQLHWGAWARGNDGAEWMERYKTYCFYVFDNIPFTPFRPLWWAVLPLAASAGVIVYECVPDTGKDGIEVCSRSWGREGGSQVEGSSHNPSWSFSSPRSLNSPLWGCSLTMVWGQGLVNKG